MLRPTFVASTCRTQVTWSLTTTKSVLLLFSFVSNLPFTLGHHYSGNGHEFYVISVMVDGVQHNLQRESSVRRAQLVLGRDLARRRKATVSRLARERLGLETRC